MKIGQKLQNIKGHHILIGTFILLLIILRIPSIFEPHWYSDEGLFASIANALSNGALLYKDVWDNKPPGIFALYLLANYAGSLNLVVIKILSLLFSIATLILTYKTAKKVFNQKIGILSALIATLLLGPPVIEANIANCENFFVFFTGLGIYLSLKGNFYKTFLAGISFGIATLFSINPFFEFLAIVLYLIAINIRKSQFRRLIKKLVVLVGGYAVAWLIMLLYLSQKGIMNEFVYAILTYNIETIQNFSSQSLGFLISPNTLFVRIIFVAVAIFFVIYGYFKKSLENSHLLMLLWGTLVVFAVLFQQKPYPHYLIQAVPVFSMITGLLIDKLNTESSFIIKAERLTILVLSVLFVLNLFTHGKPFPQSFCLGSYYVNFYRYLTGRVDTISYTQFFGEETYHSYRLNSLLKQNYSDTKSTYVWTDNPWIYDLADIEGPTRYLLSHQASENWEEVEESLSTNLVELVIIDTTSQPPHNLILYLEEHNYEFERNFESYRLFLYNNQ